MDNRIYVRRWWIWAVLSLSLVVITLDVTIVNVALPTIVRELHATASQLQWIVDAYVLVYAGLLLTLGALGDRYGRKLLLNVGLVIFALSSVAAAFAGSAGALIAARAAMGIGGAAIMPATLSIITDVFRSSRERGRAIGGWAAMAGLGIGIGPALGGWMLEHFWWGLVFFLNVPVATVALVCGAYLVPESKDPHATPLDPIGGLLSIAGLGALVYAIIEAPNDGWTDPIILSAFAAAAVIFVAFVWWEPRVACWLLAASADNRTPKPQVETLAEAKGTALEPQSPRSGGVGGCPRVGSGRVTTLSPFRPSSHDVMGMSSIL